MVVDASSANTQFELSLAVSRAQEVSTRANRQPLRIIPIVTELNQLHGPSREFLAIRRPLELSINDEFVWQLGHAFERLAMEMGLAQQQEPRRLLDAKEYRAAVISAMTLLETTLRQRLNKPAREALNRPMSIRQLVLRALEDGMPQEDYDLVLGWSKLRNDAVHTGRPVSRHDAKAIVEGVERIILGG